MKDISDQTDIVLLIDSFYEKVLQHDELSYFFKHAIGNWTVHKQAFVKYWSKQVLFEDSYEGSPLHAHIAVDQMYDKSFAEEHFNEWARIWVETVSELFDGQKAELAKESGKNMARNIYLKMFLNRHKDKLG